MTSIGPDWVAKRCRRAADCEMASLVTTSARPSQRTRNTPLGFRWKLPPPVAPVDRVDLAPVADRQPDRPAVLVEHAGVHREGDLVGARAEAGSSVGEAAHRSLAGPRGDQLEPPPRGSQHR